MRLDPLSTRTSADRGICFSWGNAVLANGRWAGYLLRPLVLALLRLPPETGPADLPSSLHDTHVEFVSDQPCVDDEKYAGSVTLLELV